MMEYCFEEKDGVSPPGIHFMEADYVAYTEVDGDYSFSSFSSENSLRRYLENFGGEVKGVRANGEENMMCKALEEFLGSRTTVCSSRTGNLQGFIYAEYEQPLLFDGEEIGEFDELFENTETRFVQEAT